MAFTKIRKKEGDSRYPCFFFLAIATPTGKVAYNGKNTRFRMRPSENKNQSGTITSCINFVSYLKYLSFSSFLLYKKEYSTALYYG